MSSPSNPSKNDPEWILQQWNHRYDPRRHHLAPLPRQPRPPSPPTWQRPRYDYGEALITTPLRGFRRWDMIAGKLKALNHRHTYKLGINQAECHYGPWYESEARHKSPKAECSCGFYATHVPRWADGHSEQIFGVIEATGTIVLGTTGFRAEKVEIVALQTDERYLVSAARRKLRENYPDIPVYRSKKKMLRDFPPISVEDLLRNGD